MLPVNTLGIKEPPKHTSLTVFLLWNQNAVYALKQYKIQFLYKYTVYFLFTGYSGVWKAKGS